MLTKVMVQVIINAAPPATEMTIIIAVKIKNNVTLDKDNISYLKELKKNEFNFSFKKEYQFLLRISSLSVFLLKEGKEKKYRIRLT